MKEKATTMAKIQAMRTFFVIGILEQFEDTLKVFETILPSYYSGVLDIWQSDSKSFEIVASKVKSVSNKMKSVASKMKSVASNMKSVAII